MATHARYSPSKLDKLRKCIRYTRVEQDEDESGAAEGTLLHAKCRNWDMVGLSQEQQQLVLNAKLAIERVVLDLDTDFPGLQFEHIVETEDDRGPTWLELKDRTFGTADRILLSHDRTVGVVVDYKFVRLDELDYEFQLQTYGAGLVEKYPTLKKVRTVIIAPRLGEIVPKDYDAQALYKEVTEGIDALLVTAHNPFSAPTAHPTLCNSCQWQHCCTALGHKVVAIAEAAVPALKWPAALDPSAIVTDEQRAIRRAMAETVYAWAEQVKEVDNEYAKSGGQMPGYKVISKSTGLSIVKEQNLPVIQKLLTLGYEMDEILATVKLHPKQLAEAHCALSQENPEVELDRLRSELKDYVMEGRTSYFQRSKARQPPVDLFHQLTDSMM